MSILGRGGLIVDISKGSRKSSVCVRTALPPVAAWSSKGANEALGWEQLNPHSQNKGARHQYMPYSRIGKATGNGWQGNRYWSTAK